LEKERAGSPFAERARRLFIYRQTSQHGHDHDHIDLLVVLLLLRPKDCQVSQHRAWGGILVRGSTSRVGLALRDQRGELSCPPVVEYGESRISRTPCDSHDARHHVSSLCSCLCTSHWILSRYQSSEPFAYMPLSLASPGTSKTEVSSRLFPIRDGSEIKHQHVRATIERLLPGERVESSRCTLVDVQPTMHNKEAMRWCDNFYK
jgi:hypothetical protein